MSDQLIAAIIAGTFSLAAIAWTIHSNQKRDREIQEREDVRALSDKTALEDVEKQRIESQAYDRARESYEAALSTRQDEIASFARRLEDCEKRAARAEQRADRLAEELTREKNATAEVREKMRNLTVVVSVLRREYIKNGLEWPDHLPTE